MKRQRRILYLAALGQYDGGGIVGLAGRRFGIHSDPSQSSEDRTLKSIQTGAMLRVNLQDGQPVRVAFCQPLKLVIGPFRVGFVCHKHRPLLHPRLLGVRLFVPAQEQVAPLFQLGEDLLRLLDGVCGKVYHYEEQVRVPEEAEEARLHIAIVDGRRVDQLDLDVVQLQDPRQRQLRREGIRGHLCGGAGEGGQKLGLTGVRKAYQDRLAGTLFP